MKETFSTAPFESGGFCSAGVPPAVFEFAAARKNAGETPALQRHSHLWLRLRGLACYRFSRENKFLACAPFSIRTSGISS
jgi:hypothetical protein